MRKLISTLFISLAIIFSISCGGGGGGDTAPAPGDPDIEYPIIRGDDDGTPDEFLVVLDGEIEDRVDPPLEWDVEYLGEGEYEVQIRAMVNGQPDYPLKFLLIILPYSDANGRICTTYEMLPDTGHGQSFKPDKLIFEVCR